MLNLILPQYCVGCGKEGSCLCFFCEESISKQSGTLFLSGNNLKVVLFAGAFKNPIWKNLIHQFKYEKVFNLSGLLAKEMAKVVRAHIPREDFLLVSIPLYWWKKQSRGFNQAEVLAKSLAKKLDRKFCPALWRIRNTKTQTALSQKERQENVKNVFQLNPRFRDFIQGKNVLLVDDVFTTGATLNEAAKVLKRAGAREVWGLVVARD